MQMSNTCSIPASIEATWQALNDPGFLKDCIAGCESIERVGENEYKVALLAKVGPVSARFGGRMLLEDLDPPKAYTVRFEGQGGAAGFAKGQARVHLTSDAANTTTMTYDVNAQVGGKLAQIGSRLVDAAARKVADDFFAAFTAKIATVQAAPAAETALAQGNAPATREPQRRSDAWMRWTLAGIVAAGAAWWIASRLA